MARLTGALAFALIMASLPVRMGLSADGHHERATSMVPQIDRQATQRLSKLPQYRLKVLLVRTCDDDGTDCSTATKSAVQGGLDVANAIYARSGTGIRFELDPRSKFTAGINDTVMNHDCVIPAGVVPEKITKEDVNGDGAVNQADKDLVCDSQEHRAALAAYALKYPESIVVFSRGVPDKPVWDAEKGHWSIEQKTGGSSSCNGFYINMPKGGGKGTLFAHEGGHYLCAGGHTFGARPEDVADAAARIKKYVETNGIDKNNAQQVLRLFDGDRNAVSDTPPDPSGAIFNSVHGDKCLPDKGTIPVPVTFSDKSSKTYILAPDRENIMSYFKGCPNPPFEHHLSKEQVARIRATLLGPRYSLIEGSSSTCSSPGPLGRDQRSSPAAQLLAQRFKVFLQCIKLSKKVVLPWEPVMNPLVRIARAAEEENEEAELDAELERMARVLSPIRRRQP